ncbi:MAG: hypothetical protein U9O90_04860 [Euryarchaeota archaeon]|nr:hypothetical protein [Euryarchaeota archaeon]
MVEITKIPLKRQDYCIRYGYKKTAGIDGTIEGQNFYWRGELHPISKHIEVRYQDTPGEFQVSAKKAYERYMSNNPKRESIKPIEQEMPIDQDSDKTIYLLLNIKSPITGTWYLTYGLKDRRRALLNPSHNDGLTNPISETSLTLFVLGNIDGWEQIENLAVLPRVQSNSDWNGDFFDNIRSRGTSNFHPKGKKVNHLWDAVLLVDNLYEYSRSALDNSYLLFEFEILNSEFHSNPTGIFKKLSFFDISSKTKWSRFDAVLILPTIKRFIFIESKFKSDTSENTSKYPIDQISRNLESAFLLTNHKDSLYLDWDFIYLFISPSIKSQSGTKNYERIINKFKEGDCNSIESPYNNANNSYRRDNNEYFDTFCKNIGKHIVRIYWDQLGEILNDEQPNFFAKYFERLGKENNEWKTMIEDKFREAGLID